MDRKIKQANGFIADGHQVLVSVEVKRGQGRIFDTTRAKLVEILSKIEGRAAPLTQRGRGWQTVVR